MKRSDASSHCLLKTLLLIELYNEMDSKKILFYIIRKKKHFWVTTWIARSQVEGFIIGGIFIFFS